MSWSKEARIAIAGAVAVGGVAAAGLGAKALRLELVPDVGIVRNVSLSDRSVLLRFPWAESTVEKWYLSNEENTQKLLKARQYLVNDIVTFPQGYQVDVLGPLINDQLPPPRYGVLNIKKVDNNLELGYEAEGRPGPRLAVRMGEQTVEVLADDSADAGVRWLGALFSEYGTPVSGRDQMRLGDERRNLLYFDRFGQPSKR